MSSGRPRRAAIARALLRPGHAHDDAVGRRQRHRVELDGGVDDARRGVGEELELAVVGRRHRQGAAVEQVLEEGAREGGAFGRVGAGGELVEEDERRRAGALEQLDDVAHVAAERRERLLDALLVADVGEDLFEDGQAAAGPAGTGSPACAIRQSRPTVLSATVLPPVLGPVIRRTRCVAADAQRDRHRRR